MKAKNFILIACVIAVVISIVMWMPFRLIMIKGNFIFAEVAKTAQERAKGLQNRQTLAENCGMLFVFEAEQRPNFWMKDTFIPLSIAFIDKDKNIVDIQEMAPQQIDIRYSPSKDSKYALEMHSGWFKKHGINAGDKVRVY